MSTGSRSPETMAAPAAYCTAIPLNGWRCLLMMESEISTWILVVLRENWLWICILVQSRLCLYCTHSYLPKSLAWDCLCEQQEWRKTATRSISTSEDDIKTSNNNAEAQTEALAPSLHHSAFPRTCRPLLDHNRVLGRADLSHTALARNSRTIMSSKSKLSI